MGSPPILRIPPSAILHRQVWGDECLVFHENSGDTHRLNALGTRVLDLLLQKPRTEAELTDEALALPGSDAAAISALVREFLALGLIEPSE
jgi:PqqD family protein of HPr-rel-A system